ncbi:MAG: 1-deoxy-D-xylulose-5-phosphate reductoisomerase, partial [Salaquimonas sp.]
MTIPQSIVVVGSTGSIGTSSLDVIRSHPDRMRLAGATANSSGSQLLEQAAEFQPDWILLANEAAASGLNTSA